MYSLLIFYFFYYVQANDSVTIDFLKNYINNERRPTDVILNSGWKKCDLVGTAKELSSISVRTSASVGHRRSITDTSVMFIVDLDEDENVFDNGTEYLRAPYRWLVLSSIGEERRRKLWDLPLLLDSDFVLAVRDKDTFTLTELYKPSPKGPTYTQERGYYNGSLVDTRPRREMYQRRGDVMGHELVMSNVIQESNSTQYHLPREDRLQLQYDANTKLNWAVGRLSMLMVNATPRYTFSHVYGYSIDGVWVGMVADVQAGRADFGSNCAMIFGRFGPVIFTDSIAQTKVRFIFRQPPLSYVSNIFTLPFSIAVWLAIVGCSIISILAIRLESKWEATTNVDDRADGQLSDAVLLGMSALSQQGWSMEMEPRRLSGRIMFLFVFLTTMTVYVAYSAQVTVLLQAPSSSIQTMEQLAASRMQLGAIDLVYSRYALKGFTDPFRKSISKRIMPDNGKESLYSLEECVEKMRTGPFAFHALSEPVYRRIEETFQETEKCDLMDVDFMKTFNAYIPVNKHSPYLELLRVNFKRLRESGIRSVLEERYIVPKPRCTEKPTVFVNIGIRNILPLLWLMLLGIVASLVILVMEMIVHRLVRYFDMVLGTYSCFITSFAK